MRKGWRKQKLGDVVTLNYGKPLPTDKRCAEDGFPAYGANGVKCYAATPYWDQPSIIVGRKGTAGAVNLVPGGFWPLDVTYYVTLDDSKNDLNFIYYLLLALDLPSLATGVKPGINRNVVYAIEQDFPSLPEQKRIVAILDEAVAGIAMAVANTEKNLANARELFESYLNAVFGQQCDEWDQRTLRDVCMDYGRGKSKHRPRNDPIRYGGRYPFIQTGDVRNSDHLITGYSATYSDAGLAQSKLWPKGTICITIAANIAETGVLDFDACFPDSLIGLVVNEEVAFGSYVEFLLQSVKAILKAKGKGSAQDNINLGTFEKQCFPFPDLATQKQIVENVQELRISIRGLESIYQQKLIALAELKQSLLQKAFSGELAAGKEAPNAAVKEEELA